MKTVSFDDEAYRLLKGARLSSSESFSEIVKRQFGARRDGLEKTAGAWGRSARRRFQRLKRERLAAFGTTRD